MTAKNKVQALDEAQIARFGEFRDKWLKIGLETEDFRTTDADIREMATDVYKAAGLAPPRLVIRLASPIGLQMGANLIKKLGDFGDQVGDQVGAQVRDQVGAQVRDQVWDQVGDQVGAQVRAQVWDQVGDQVRGQVGAQVWDQVGAQVRDQVGAQVRDQVWAQVWAQVRDQVGAQVWAQVRDQVRDQVGAQSLSWCNVWYCVWYGQHDAGYHAFLDYFREVCGLTAETEKMQPLMRMSRAVMWFIPFSCAFLWCERPMVLFRDGRGRLHREGGPAMAWRDGHTLHALHGNRFEGEAAKKFVEAPVDKIDPKDVLKIENVEQRSAVIRRIGVEKFVKLLPNTVLDKEGAYKLLEIDVGTTKRIYLGMQNPSIDHYHLEAVHPKCRKVTEALAWRNFGDHKHKWEAPEVLT